MELEQRFDSAMRVVSPMYQEESKSQMKVSDGKQN